ncbi:myosin heavy chain, skeletal muscle-like [Capsella rubella]|uniref:myosin heavy chain, skeletal muscle-like n=1 Tax=Capsella rubella TaxID=81985 RepID=UPI000CD553A3|nr:myosin heavy chain, skeletal muscle-like [Capsella rubella]
MASIRETVERATQQANQTIAVAQRQLKKLEDALNSIEEASNWSDRELDSYRPRMHCLAKLQQLPSKDECLAEIATLKNQIADLELKKEAVKTAQADFQTGMEANQYVSVSQSTADHLETDNEILTVLRNQTIHQSLEAARQAAQIQNNLPEEFKTVQEALYVRGTTLETKEWLRRQRRKELEKKVLTIHETENMVTEIAKSQQRKTTLTKELEDAEQLSKTSQEQYQIDKLELIEIKKQVEEQAIELESMLELLASTKRKVDRKQNRIDSLTNNFRWIDDKIVDKEATQREVDETYAKSQLYLAQIKRDLYYKKQELTQIQLDMNANIIELREASKSIASASTRF